MRLIDADEFLVTETLAYNKVMLELLGKDDEKSYVTRIINECVHKKLHMLINDAPTVKYVEHATANKKDTEGSR